VEAIPAWKAMEIGTVCKLLLVSLDPRPNIGWIDDRTAFERNLVSLDLLFLFLSVRLPSTRQMNGDCSL
jgi:hypothetical protein